MMESLPPTTSFFISSNRAIDKSVLDAMPMGEWRTRFIHNFHENELKQILGKVKKGLTIGWSMVENYQDGYLAVVTPQGTTRATIDAILDGVPCQIQEKTNS
jgi:hypothetical protein